MALGDVKFVTTGPWGAGIARPLTAAEADGNVNELKAAIQNLIDNPVDGVSITNIEVVGRQLFFYMSDATTFGPFDLPIAYPRYAGAWVAGTEYFAYDIVKLQNYGTYMVLLDHIAVDPFDPAAFASDGDIYAQIAPPTTEQAQIYSGDVLIIDPTYVGGFIICDNPLGCEVQLNSEVDNHAQISFRQGSDAPITFTDLGGVIEGMQDYELATGGRGSVATVKFFNGVWYLFGRLAEVV